MARLPFSEATRRGPVTGGHSVSAGRINSQEALPSTSPGSSEITDPSIVKSGLAEDTE